MILFQNDLLLFNICLKETKSNGSILQVVIFILMNKNIPTHLYIF